MNYLREKSRNKIAIMLATFNGAEYIEEQIFSILWQTHQNFRLYIRDDGSTDNTEKIISEMALRDSRIEILASSGKNRTGSAACNFFKILCEIDPMEYSYFSFADQDDIWAPLKLEAGLALLIETNSSGYSSNLIAFDRIRNNAWYAKKDQSQTKFDYLFQGASAGCTYIFDHKVFAKTRTKIMPLLDNMPKLNSHDWIVYAIARSSHLKWIMDSESYIYYRQHESNAYGSKTGLRKILFKISMLRNGWFREHVLWNQKILDNTPSEKLILEKVKMASMVSRIWLAFRSVYFRRSNKEKIALAFLVLSGLFYQKSNAAKPKPNFIDNSGKS